MAVQDGHTSSKFLEPRHHRHRHTIHEFDHSSSADGTITGHVEPRYAGQGGTGLAEATKGMAAILFSAVDEPGS